MSWISEGPLTRKLMNPASVSVLDMHNEIPSACITRVAETLSKKKEKKPIHKTSFFGFGQNFSLIAGTEWRQLSLQQHPTKRSTEMSKLLWDCLFYLFIFFKLSWTELPVAIFFPIRWVRKNSARHCLKHNLLGRWIRDDILQSYKHCINITTPPTPRPLEKQIVGLSRLAVAVFLAVNISPVTEASLCL